MSAADLAAELGPATALMIDAMCELEQVGLDVGCIGESGLTHRLIDVVIDTYGDDLSEDVNNLVHTQRAWLLISEAAECLAAADERGQDIRSDGPKDCSAAVLRAAEDYGRALRAARAARGGQSEAPGTGPYAKALEAVATALEALRAALGIDDAGGK